MCSKTSNKSRKWPLAHPLKTRLIAAEIDTIERFPRADKLCADAGLVPTTQASGGQVRTRLPLARTAARGGTSNLERRKIPTKSFLSKPAEPA